MRRCGDLQRRAGRLSAGSSASLRGKQTVRIEVVGFRLCQKAIDDVRHGPLFGLGYLFESLPGVVVDAYGDGLELRFFHGNYHIPDCATYQDVVVQPASM